MATPPSLQLFDPRNGGLALRVEPFAAPAQPQRTNYFTVFWVQHGSGLFTAGGGSHPFQASALLFLSPYQSFEFICTEPAGGLRLQFHANFLCIETYHHEVGCNGVLFNDTYGIPCVALPAAAECETATLLGQMQRELEECGLAHAEALLSYLKIFLIRATRLKLEQQEIGGIRRSVEPEALGKLTALLEQHFRTHHAPGDYAAMLHVSPKWLARLVKQHRNLTLTALIRERMMRQAKWELLHTRKPVKEVAAELGFADFFYFSRLFKQSTGCSPKFFREFETAIRGGDLSMP